MKILSVSTYGNVPPVQKVSLCLIALASSVVIAGQEPIEANPPTGDSPTAAPEIQSETIALERVLMVGSRRKTGSVPDSPVPVDLIDGSTLSAQGTTKLDSMLSTVIPSFNISDHPISGAGTLVRPANLRGLSSDSTLILINGKRRHRASLVTFLGGGLSDGAQGPDLQSIPYIALKRVELLRDGASAQYGSDAIAGVINLVLKDSPQGGTVETRWGQHYQGDGAAFTVAANTGMSWSLLNGGYANFSFEYTEIQATSRSIQRADAQALIEADRDHISPYIRRPYAQVWGSPAIDEDLKFFGNLGLNLGERAQIYLMPSFSRRETEGGFYYRNPTDRIGVFFDPNQPFTAIKVADLREQPDPSTVPAVRIDPDGTPNPEDLKVIAGHPDFFVYNHRLREGFTPQFGGTITDVSLTGGLRGEWENGWNYDLGAGIGQHKTEFFIRDTVNAQMIAHPDFIDDPNSFPTRFRPGNLIETDQTFNIDLSRLFDIDLFYSPLNVALGWEYRVEEFELEAGDEYSWWRDTDTGGLVDQGFSVGSNGWTGFRPENASITDRGSISSYLDLEADATEKILLRTAVRFESYEGNIGETLNGKVTVRWQAVPKMALRSSLSTGFRAPSVGQTKIRRESTTFTTDTSGQVRLVDTATLPPDALNAVGITLPPESPNAGDPLPLLEPETSINFSIGTVVDLHPLNLTLDYFHIKVSDRIALTDTIDYPADAPNRFNVNKYRFFSNFFDTTTQGVDLVVNYPISRETGVTTLSLGANLSVTQVDKGSIKDDAAITPKLIDQLEHGLPDVRGTFAVTHVQGNLDGLIRLHYYDDFVSYHANSRRTTSGARWLTDVELGYTLVKQLRLAAGAQNLFDVYPEKHPPAIAGIFGAVYPEYSPFGFNGGFYYLKATYTF